MKNLKLLNKKKCLWNDKFYIPVCQPCGIPLLKLNFTNHRLKADLFNIIPLFTYEKKINGTELKIFGIPVYLKQFFPNKVEIKLFKIMPFMTIRKKQKSYIANQNYFIR